MASSSRHPSILDPDGRRPRRERWLLAGVIAVVLVLLTSLFAFGLGRDPTVIRPVLVGHPAPAFTLTTLDGDRTVGLASLRGQVVLVNFWASWCVPCRVEQPALRQLWERYRDQGAVVLGVSFEDAVSSARSSATQYGSTWPLLSDPGSRTAIAYGVVGVPETFLIAPDGTIAGKRIGAVSYGPMSEEIAQLLPGVAT